MYTNMYIYVYMNRGCLEARSCWLDELLIVDVYIEVQPGGANGL
jgi:hypothetical protein